MSSIQRYNSQDTGLSEILQIADIAYKSGMYTDVKDANQAAMKLLVAKDLNISPTLALSSVYIIQGKPVLSANLMASLLQASRLYAYKIIKLDNEACEMEIYEISSKDPDRRLLLGTSTFTFQDAVEAELPSGKNSHTWKKFRRNMLFARCISNAIKWYCPSLFMGMPVYTPDELDIKEDENGYLDVSSINVSSVASSSVLLAPADKPQLKQAKNQQQNIEDNRKQPHLDSMDSFDDSPVMSPEQIQDSLIKQIDDEMTKKRISRNTASALLQSTCGKKLRKDCSNDELNGFLEALKTYQPEPAVLSPVTF